MSADIGPGDWLEAVKADPFHDGLVAVEKGGVHQVTDVFDMGCWLFCDDCREPGRVAFLIHGDRPEGGVRGRCRCGWRPIYRPKADFLESLLRPVELPETVDA